MPQYEAIAHVLWEMPFVLQLPPEAFFTWEPDEGVALFDPRPEVGEIDWRRKSSFLPATEVFANVGLPNHCYSTQNYLIKSKLRSGKEINTAILKGGAEGGFCEARPYTIANIFLCLRRRNDYSTTTVLQRASAVLNNILDIYRFLTLDPLIRSIKSDQDCYYALVSVADLPPICRVIEPKIALGMVDTLSFGCTIGKSRVHHIGLNSLDDLLSGDVLPKDTLRLFNSLISTPHALELFHQLVFSSIRRLKRNEHALAVIDAESAFESLVAVLVVESLSNEGYTPQQIEAAMAPGGKVHLLLSRLKKIDSVALAQTAANTQPSQFLGSHEEVQWRTALYNLRNRIVHEGLRDVPFSSAKAALVACLHAMHRIQSLNPAFNRVMTWSGSAIDLGHIQQSAGRLSRLFEV